jgi:radical SAM superfamily enzyme YgiQ (UPF0313 family)
MALEHRSGQKGQLRVAQEHHRILLVSPPFYRLFKNTYSLDTNRLGLAYLAAVIRRETNWNVLLYNSDFYPQGEPWSITYLTGKGFHNYSRGLHDLSLPVWSEVRGTISQYRPDAVGIASTSADFGSAQIVARLAKEIDGSITVIVGGPHASTVGSEVLKSPFIDVYVRGEGEKTIVELLTSIDRGKSFRGIDGLGYREHGKVVENPPRKYIANLDSLPFPHTGAQEVLKDYPKYPASAFGNIMATRGCFYDCLFCGSREIWGRKVRFRSPANVVEEIRGLQRRGVRSISFEDDTFGGTDSYLHELCQAIIKHCPGLKWSCEIRANLVKEQNIALMKAAGCYRIQIGVESGNNAILRAVRKNLTIEQTLEACKIIKKHGMELETFFMIGFPWETTSTLNDTLAAMGKASADKIVYNIFTPYPGTEAFDLCKGYGLIREGHDPSLHYHQSPANCFCMNMSCSEFGAIARGIEVIVERYNRVRRIRMLFLSSPASMALSFVRKIQKDGVAHAFRVAATLLRGDISYK